MILEAKRKAAEDENKPKPTKAKTKGKKSLFELHEKFTNEIKNDEKNINQQIFKEYFYHTPLFLAKELYNSNQNVTNETVKHVNNAFIALKKDVNGKKIPKTQRR